MAVSCQELGANCISFYFIFTEDIRIIPKGKGDHSCLTIIDDVPADVGPRLKSWPPIIIEGVTNFTARIGPTGGKRGYTAITGKKGFNIII